jgi:hypothetical protein
MKPAASSLASSFLMASRLSSAKRRRYCRFGVALGSTLSECSINSLGTPVLTVKIRQPSHEFTFGVGMSFIPYPLVLTPVV